MLKKRVVFTLCLVYVLMGLYDSQRIGAGRARMFMSLAAQAAEARITSNESQLSHFYDPKSADLVLFSSNINNFIRDPVFPHERPFARFNFDIPFGDRSPHGSFHCYRVRRHRGAPRHRHRHRRYKDWSDYVVPFVLGWALHNYYDQYQDRPYRIETLPNNEEEYKREKSAPVPRDQYRSGFCYYTSEVADDLFKYKGWLPAYDPRGSAVSPWYYYTNLPGYLALGCVTYSTPMFPVSYTLKYPYDEQMEGVEPQIDSAIHDFTKAFALGDPKRLNRVIPGGRAVYLRLEDGPFLRTDSDHFLSQLSDVIHVSRTKFYQVIEVKTRATPTDFSVLFEHRFMPACGGRSVMYHVVNFTWIPQGYVVKEFITYRSKSRL